MSTPPYLVKRGMAELEAKLHQYERWYDALRGLELRRMKIEKELIGHRVLWQDPMFSGRRFGLQEMLAAVRRDYDRVKVELYDLRREIES